MNTTTILEVGLSRQIIRLLSVLLYLFALGACQIGRAQVSVNLVSDKIEVRERIAVLISEALHEGEGTVNGISTWSRTPPSNKAIEEIKKYGDDSVAVLARYLDSDNERERGIAIEFLGALGGRRIVIPLRNVIRYDSSAALRIKALHWISQTPWELALPVIREASESDLDQKVRRAAKDILLNHRRP